MERCPVGIGSQITAVLRARRRQSYVASDQNRSLSALLCGGPAGPPAAAPAISLSAGFVKANLTYTAPASAQSWGTGTR